VAGVFSQLKAVVSETVRDSDLLGGGMGKNKREHNTRGPPVVKEAMPIAVAISAFVALVGKRPDEAIEISEAAMRDHLVDRTESHLWSPINSSVAVCCDPVSRGDRFVVVSSRNSDGDTSPVGPTGDHLSHALSLVAEGRSGERAAATFGA
jgi:hypothetical protein